jgi:hypothetical protein
MENGKVFSVLHIPAPCYIFRWNSPLEQVGEIGRDPKFPQLPRCYRPNRSLQGRASPSLPCVESHPFRQSWLSEYHFVGENMRFSGRKREFYLAAIHASGEFEAEIRLRVLSRMSLSAPSLKHFEGKFNSRASSSEGPTPRFVSRTE